MASPQVENGFTRIANEILEVLARADFMDVKSKIIDWICRNSYGYQRHWTKPCGIRKLSSSIWADCGSTSRAVKILLKKKIIEYQNDCFRLQKDWQKWQDGVSQWIRLSTSVDNSKRGVVKTQHQPKEVLQKDKFTVAKEQQKFDISRRRDKPLKIVVKEKDLKKRGQRPVHSVDKTKTRHYKRSRPKQIAPLADGYRKKMERQLSEKRNA